MRILFCLAGQRLREQWNKAAALIDLGAHEVTILHVVDDSLVATIDAVQHYGLPRRVGTEREARMQQALQEAGRRIIAEALAAAHSAGVPATGLVRRGQPSTVILQVAAEIGAEVIILGRQHPGLEGKILGGVCRFVVDQAPCTVVVLR